MKTITFFALEAKLWAPVLAALLVLGLCAGCSGGGAAAGNGTGTTGTSANQRPCDLLASTTPCVAAFSTTRALFIAYAGPLYQVTRASDGSTQDIGLLSDGYANAAAQDTFCTNTTCTITEIYDQSSNHNNLTPAPPGGADRGQGPNGYDLPAVATALPVTAGGHKVYGVSILPGMGYRIDTTTGIAVNGQAEGVYMVSSLENLDSGCCFDFGNAEVDNKDNGAGHMDAMNLHCVGTPCAAIAGLDMENGIYGRLAVPAGPTFVTVMGANDGQTEYAIWQGNAQSGSLTTTGATPLPSGYAPMKQEGAIILGIGGDNSNRSSGYFFEGVMTKGAPGNTSMSNVQSNIISAGYTGL